MLRLCLFFFCFVVVIPQPSAAQITEIRLQKLLSALADKDYKVRLQAAIILGRLKEGRSVPALIMRLDDTNSLVRGMSAHALGLIGDSRALVPLKKMSRDSSSIVRQRVALAIRQINKQVRLEGSRKRHDRPTVIQIRLSRMVTNTKLGKPLLPKMRQLWITQLSADPRLRLMPAQSQKLGQRFFEMTSTLTKLDWKRSKQTLAMTCSISLIVGDHQGKILMMTSGGATVEESIIQHKRAQLQELQESALENAINSAFSNMLRFLLAQEAAQPNLGSP